jgi:hypothetical protein
MIMSQILQTSQFSNGLLKDQLSSKINQVNNCTKSYKKEKLKFLKTVKIFSTIMNLFQIFTL